MSKIFTRKNTIIGASGLAAAGITVFAVRKIRARKRAAASAPGATPDGITVNAPQKRGIWPFRKEVAAPALSAPTPTPTEA